MIKIISDSACDLSDDVISNNDIGIVPITIVIDGKEYKDGVDIKSDEIYEILSDKSVSLTTAAPGPKEYLTMIKKSIEKGYKEILCVSISNNISVSYKSALIAKKIFFEENPKSPIKIYILDSFCVGQENGLLILKSIEIIQQGFDFEETINIIEKYKKRVRHLLCVNDLDVMAKSGRISNLNASVGKLLNIKPILTMIEGTGTLVGKERGMNKVINFYVKELEDNIDKENFNFIIVSYTSDIKLAEKLVEKIKSEISFSGKIYMMRMGAAVGVYVGLGSIAMYYASKQEQ